MIRRRLSTHVLLFIAIVLAAFLLTACGGADATDEPVDTTTTEVTTDDETDSETQSESEAEDESEAESETEEASVDTANTRIVITGLTSEEEMEVEEGYPCTIAIVGEGEAEGTRLSGIIKRNPEADGISVTVTFVGDEFQVSSHVVNSDGLWYEMLFNGRFYGFIQEQYVAIGEDCPLYDYEAEG